MKQPSLLRRTGLILALPLLLVLFWSPPSLADAIDGLANLLEKVEDAGVPPNWLPIKSGDIRASKGLIVCLDNAGNDVAVANCINDYENTPIGSSLSGQAGIPSWVFDLLELYISYREGDYWGVVKYLGKAAMCVVAQVMTGGAVDVCGLIEDLVKVAEELLDAAKAVAKFFQSVGEGAWEAAKAVGCSLGLGGCGESSPPEQIAYAWVFQPKVGQGLTAMEAINPAGFYALKQQLEQNALHAPPVWSIAGIPNWVYTNGLPKSAVDIASHIFTDAVDAQWTKHIVQDVLAQLGSKRSQYNNANQVTASANVVSGLNKSSASAVASDVIKQCADSFSYDPTFAHVDRWIQTHSSEATKIKALTHKQWCDAIFWKGNKSQFAQHFYDYLKTHGCSVVNEKLKCSTITSYNNCSALMQSVGQNSSCLPSGTMGSEVAKAVRDALIAKGSKYPCTVSGKLKLATKTHLVCSRPTLQHHCKETYKTLYPNLPQDLLSCDLKMDSNYAALEKAVKTKVNQLNSLSGMPVIGPSQYDPLVILAASSSVVAAVQSLPNQDFGFGPPSTSKGFEYHLLGSIPKLIDGVDTPLLMYEHQFDKNFPVEKKNPFEKKLDLINPIINPVINQGDVEKLPDTVAANPLAAGIANGQKLPQQQNGMQNRGGFVPQQSVQSLGNMQQIPITAPQLPGPDGGGSLPQQKIMQGELPKDSRQKGGFVPQRAGPGMGNLKQVPITKTFIPGQEVNSGLANQKALHGSLPTDTKNTMPSLPRTNTPTPTLRGGTIAQPTVTIWLGGRQWNWGDRIILPDQQATAISNGLCSFELRQQWSGSGLTTEHVSRRLWQAIPTGATAHRSAEQLIPGGIELVDRLLLKPGQNRLTLLANSTSMPSMRPLQIEVTGSCRPAGRLGLPKNEATDETATPQPMRPAPRLQLPSR
ncbi:MAG: hypothetical protein FHK82_08585 [Sedimenticola thiotaurini]|uniref:Uncharacterized protein n=1 Tax=Sedimenticola thiotaurini TaxID=1543721 RepID=A0A558D321_9GAMM|nr:MAG: hypothetical protein FHK82_08585 [Sedimenticola thiotaurini]